MPLFADPRVGFVQSPQDHRDGDRSLMHHAMNAEYAGFFDIGMVQRNEVNAIIVHGTMCLIRRAALESAGGWSSDTIVEDTDLGLASSSTAGSRITPTAATATASCPTRSRPTSGSVIAGHLAASNSCASIGASCCRAPRRSRASKSANSARLAQLARRGNRRRRRRALNIVWVPIVAFANIAVPDRILTLPIIAAFVVSVAHFVALYRLRVRASPRQMVGAVFAAMSMQWTVARAVGFGSLKERLPFLRTAKGGVGRKGPDFPASGKPSSAAFCSSAAR